NQCIRDNGEVSEGFDDPITQVKNAKLLLEKWLYDKQLAGLPIYTLIAFANAQTIIKIEGNTTIDNITRVKAVPNKIIELDQSLPKKNQTLKGKITSNIIQTCKDFDMNLNQKYNLKPADIQTGVQCPICYTHTMYWSRKSWHCQKCEHKSKDAHIKALYDYQLLFGKEISNATCRKFL